MIETRFVNWNMCLRLIAEQVNDKFDGFEGSVFGMFRDSYSEIMSLSGSDFYWNPMENNHHN